MKSNQLISEISRIQEMMGILNESKSLLKESIGDEIAEILVKFLGKSSDELLALGVRNPEDLKSLLDDFLDPLVPAIQKTDMLKLIIDDLGTTAISNIAKSAVDDVTTGVGKIVNDRVNSYMTMYKKGIATADDVITAVKDDLATLMAKSSDELSALKTALNDEALAKTRNMLDNAGRAADEVVDDAFEKLLKDNANVEKVLERFRGRSEWSKLKDYQQVAIENFVKKNKSLDFASLLARTNDEMIKTLTKNASESTVKKIWAKWKSLSPTKQWLIGIALAGGVFTATGGTALCAIRNAFDWVGEWTGFYDLEDQEKWNKCDTGVQKNMEEPEPSTTCNQDLDKFKAWLKSQGFSDERIGTANFDSKTCSGTITLGDGSLGKLTWDGSTYK